MVWPISDTYRKEKSVFFEQKRVDFRTHKNRPQKNSKTAAAKPKIAKSINDTWGTQKFGPNF